MHTMLAIVVEFQLSSCKSSRSCSSQYKKKKKKKGSIEKKGRDGFHLVGTCVLFLAAEVVKSVKKDVESRVESKGLYRGIMVVFFFNF